MPSFLLSVGVRESLGLQCIQAQKGFSHEGHMRTGEIGSFAPYYHLFILLSPIGC